MSSAESLAPRTLLPPLRPTLDTHGPACRIAESRHTTDMAAFFTVCLCTANSGETYIGHFLLRRVDFTPENLSIELDRPSDNLISVTLAMTVSDFKKAFRVVGSSVVAK